MGAVLNPNSRVVPATKIAQVMGVMKKLLLAFLGLTAGSCAFSQAYFNANNNYTPVGASQKAFVLDGRTGAPLSKDVGRVQIIHSADGVTLSPNGDLGVALSLDGLFFINGLVPGEPYGASTVIVVRAWDSSTGATWADASCRSEPNSGFVIVNSLGGGTLPGATFYWNSNFRGLEVCPIPEPTTVSLAVLGLAGLFLGIARTGAHKPKLR